MNPEEIKFECSQCGQHISAPREQAGLAASCPTCNSPVTVPLSDQVVIEPPHHSSPPPLLSISTQTPPPEPDVEKLNGARAAFLVLPLYMLGFLFLLPALWESLPKSTGTVRLMFWLAIPMIGIALKSLQCVFWLSTDPFRAVATGRYLFGIYLVFWAIGHLFGEWPTAKVEGPLAGITQQSGYGYSSQNVFVINKPAEFQIFEPTLLSYLGFLLQFGGELAEKGAIFAFILAAYRMLRSGREEYTFDHFCYDVTFGKAGTNYAKGNIGQSSG